MSKPGEGKFFAATSEEGPYCIGPCDSYEDAVTEAKAEFADEMAEGAEIVIGKGRDVYVEIDAEDVIDGLANGSLYEELYEDALDGWCVKMPREKYADLSKRLTDVLHQWLDENGQPKFWSVVTPVSERSP